MEKSKVLIVVDMQNDFITGSLGSKETLAVVPNVVKKIKEWEGSIIVTLDTHRKDYFETLEGKMLPIEHCIRETNGWELDPKVAEALPSHYISLEKPTFGSTILPKLVTNCKEFHIIGVCTDICVISNALLLRAYNPNAKIVVDASCCAGTIPERHKMALEVLKSCQIEVINEE